MRSSERKGNDREGQERRLTGKNVHSRRRRCRKLGRVAAYSGVRRTDEGPRVRPSEAHNRPDADFELLRHWSSQDHETAAESDRAARKCANFWIDQNGQPFRLGADREPGTDELFQAGAETERKAREVIARSGDVRDADAPRQKASETLDFLDDELAREIRVNLPLTRS